MSLKFVAVPFFAAAAVAVGLAAAPTAAAASDPCKLTVSAARCLGPQGVDRNAMSSPRIGSHNGPFEAWSRMAPIG